jgi:hypothetical protein
MFASAFSEAPASLMGALLIVQLDDRTPTGLSSGSFSIHGILGRAAISTFMK